ncbi:hypothetical protein BKA82DRAFT_149946, partial [Pisolithus tinctorius]
MVRHSGKNGCWVYCLTPGRQKFHCTHYYPALLKPWGNCMPGSDHPDINIFQLPLGGSSDYAYNLNCLVSTPSQQQWDMCKTETAITKPPLILGLNPSQSLGVPLCMTMDLMCLVGNLSDLLISLWCGVTHQSGMMKCGHTDDKGLWDWA